MTINDMIEQGIEIQGRTEVRLIKDDEITEIENFPSGIGKPKNPKLLDMEIYYMFPIDADNGTLIFEVKEQE